MRKSMLLAFVLMTALAFAQTTTTPQSGTSTTTPPDQSTMPPDTAAPPPTQNAPEYNEDQQDTTNSDTTATQQQESSTQQGSTLPEEDTDAEPTLGSRPAEARTTGTTGSNRRMIAAETKFKATLDEGLSSKKSRAGDTFTATIQEELRAADGTALIPVGSKLHGEVTAAEEGKNLPSVRGKGKLNLRFINITTPNGRTYPVTASLVSVHNSEGDKADKASTDEEGQVEGRVSGKEAAKNVGIGAAIGTVGGLIFGSALKGLAIGAIAGGGYVLATQGKDVELPADSGMVVKLDHNLVVPATTAGR